MPCIYRFQGARVEFRFEPDFSLFCEFVYVKESVSAPASDSFLSVLSADSSRNGTIHTEPFRSISAVHNLTLCALLSSASWNSRSMRLTASASGVITLSSDAYSLRSVQSENVFSHTHSADAPVIVSFQQQSREHQQHARCREHEYRPPELPGLRKLGGRRSLILRRLGFLLQ